MPKQTFQKVEFLQKCFLHDGLAVAEGLKLKYNIIADHQCPRPEITELQKDSNKRAGGLIDPSLCKQVNSGEGQQVHPITI